MLEQPKVIAHRGLRNEFPENTLLAISEALKLDNLFGVEFDVELCDQPVVLHQETFVPDANFSRLVPAHRDYTSRDWVSSARAEAICKMDAGSWLDPKFSALRVPLLREILALNWGETTAVIELKDSTYWGKRELDRPKRMLDAVVPELLRFTGKVMLLSFNPEMLAQAAQRAPQCNSTLGLWIEWTGRAAEAVEAARGCGAGSIAIADAMLLFSPQDTDTWIEQCQQAQLKLCVYPVSPAHDEPEYSNWNAEKQHARWAQLCDLGVAAFVSDFARATLELFRSKQRER